MSEVASLLADLATAIGIPLAVVVFLVERHRDRRDREFDTYRALSDRYFGYLQILFENPELSTTETDWIRGSSPGRNPRQDLLVQMAVNMIETAYFLYRDHRSEFRKAQWQGWRLYLEDWCTHPAFVAKWPEIVEQYDEGFRRYVEGVYERVHGPKHQEA